MRKKSLVITAVGLILSSSSFGYISGKIKADEPIYYCPSQVVCTAEGDIRSCKFENSNMEYWNPVITDSKYKVVSGIYKLNSVMSSYHSAARPSASCRYNDPLTQQEAVFIGEHDLSNLEVYYGKTSAWLLDGDISTCTSNIPELCPLHESSGVYIKDQNIRDLVAKINNIQFSLKFGPAPGILYVRYNDALAGCPGKFCKIDIASSKGAIYGSITVDMDNRMKIVTVEALRQSEIEINRIDPFNAVEVRYHDPLQKSTKSANQLPS